MTLSVYAAVAIALLLALVAIRKRRSRRRGIPRRRPGSVGPGAAGAIYDLLNEDRRKAIEVIVEQKTGYRVAEHPDDVPPDVR